MNASRLIEEWLPINEISVEAIRERAGAIPNPEPHQLHVWWARRPLAPSRAAVAASMLPTSFSREEFIATLGTYFGIYHDQERMSNARQQGENQKLGYANRRSFTHNPTYCQLESLHRAALQLTGEPAPIILDVTAGGGSIPFEAGRLGFRTIANELNPVACLILRATCEWPQRFGRQLLEDYQEASEKFQVKVRERLANAYPDQPQPDCGDGNCPHPQRYRCVEDCQDGDSCNHTNIGSENHAAVRAQRDWDGFLWARTAICPACNSVIPLSPNWRLDNKGTGIRVEPVGQECQFRIVHDRSVCPDCGKSDTKKPCNTATLHPDGEISAGTTSRAVAVCPQPNCGTTTPKGYLAKEAQAGRMGHQLYAVIYRDSWTEKTKAGKDKKRPTTFRGFAEVRPDHNNGDFIDRELARLETQWATNDVLPSEEVPPGNDRRPYTYGMEKWVKMFNPRQQLAHGHCVEAFHECVEEDRAAEALDKRRKAAWAYVGISLDKMINRNSLLCMWDPGTDKIAQTFATHDFGFKWSYAEMPVTNRMGGLKWAINNVADCLAEMLEMTNQGETPVQLLNPEDPGSIPTPSEVINGEAHSFLNWTTAA